MMWHKYIIFGCLNKKEYWVININILNKKNEIK